MPLQDNLLRTLLKLRPLAFLVFWILVPTGGWVEAKTHNETLTIADMTVPPSTLDPFKIYGTQAQSLFRQIYDSLIDRDESGRLIPAIAERWNYRGNDIWRLEIRKGVYFQNGSRLSSSYVKFSLERLLAPSSVRARRRDFSFIIRVETVGEYEVDIHTRGPAPMLPARLAQFSMIISAKKFHDDQSNCHIFV